MEIINSSSNTVVLATSSNTVINPKSVVNVNYSPAIHETLFTLLFTTNNIFICPSDEELVKYNRVLAYLPVNLVVKKSEFAECSKEDPDAIKWGEIYVKLVAKNKSMELTSEMVSKINESYDVTYKINGNDNGFIMELANKIREYAGYNTLGSAGLVEGDVLDTKVRELTEANDALKTRVEKLEKLLAAVLDTTTDNLASQEDSALKDNLDNRFSALENH